MTLGRSEFRIMGIDPGTIACGWAVGTLDGCLLASGAIVQKARAETHTRIFNAAEALAEIGIKHQVHSYFCEAPLVYLGAKPALVLGALSGVINYVIWKTAGGMFVNFIESASVRHHIGVPGLKRPKRGKRPKGAMKANALRWIRTLMTDIGLPYDKSCPVPQGEEDRLEAIGIYWAGCSELTAGIDDAIDRDLAKMKGKRK